MECKLLCKCFNLQVRDPRPVRLLPAVGAQLGVQEEGDPGRGEALRGRHHRAPGGRDGPVLQILSAGTQT